jgi:hypothetical protein
MTITPSGDSGEEKIAVRRDPSEIAEEIDASVQATDKAITDDPTDLTLDRVKQEEVHSHVAKTPDRPYKAPLSPRTKKRQLIVMLSLLGLVILGAAAMVLLPRLSKEEEPSTQQEVASKETEKVTPKTVPSPITGVDVSEQAAARPVTAVMIENSPSARPQSGISGADLVFEAIAEGGITRYVALFQSASPAYIGPIRSARPYYVQIAKSFDAAFVHAGGSPDGLAKITELNVKDMSAFENNGTYVRDDSREAPHNLYSSMEKLLNRQTELGFSSSTFGQWQHKNETPQTPTAANIDFTMSSPTFNPSFSYNAASNNYTRLNGGIQDVDANGNIPIQPRVVIALITDRSQQGQYSVYRLTGSGEARIFQDGIVSTASWTKDNDMTQFSFKDKNGLPFVFNKGQVWVTVVDSASDVTYTP